MTAREWLAALADQLDAYATASERKAQAAAESAAKIRAELERRP